MPKSAPKRAPGRRRADRAAIVTGLRSRIVGHEEVPADQLLANPWNFRRHGAYQRSVLRGSLDELGWVKSVTVNKLTGHLIDGHARVEDALGRGDRTPVPVEYVELSEAEERLALATLDPSGALAEQDDEAALSLFANVGADDAALREFLQAQAAAATTISTGIRPDADVDEIPPVPRVASSHVGQLWSLGRHRLLCADSRSLKAWQALMDGAIGDAMWTDPPYGVAYEGKTEERLTIQNDNLKAAALGGLLRSALGSGVAHVKPGGAVYVAAPTGPLMLVFGQVLLALGVWRQTLVWVKDSFVLGRSDYHQQHEALFAGDVPDPAPRGDPEAVAELLTAEKKDADLFAYGWRPGAPHSWRGGRTLSTVLEIARPRSSREHPNMKPIALIERCLLASTDPNSLVLDGFAGSGSTLIACEKNGRRCYAIEKDPVYVDVILARWETATGKPATLIGEVDPDVALWSELG